MSNQARNLVEQQGTSWEGLFGIDAGGLTNATRDNFNVHIIGNTQKSAIAVCFYTGSAALTLSEFDALPIGSIIFDMQAFKLHLHTAATTWKSSAAAT